MSTDTTAATPPGQTFSVNGIDFHCEVRGAGEPLVLLHGFGGRGDGWRQLFDLDELARHAEFARRSLAFLGGS